MLRLPCASVWLRRPKPESTTMNERPVLWDRRQFLHSVERACGYSLQYSSVFLDLFLRDLSETVNDYVRHSFAVKTVRSSETLPVFFPAPSLVFGTERSRSPCHGKRHGNFKRLTSWKSSPQPFYSPQEHDGRWMRRYIQYTTHMFRLASRARRELVALTAFHAAQAELCVRRSVVRGSEGARCLLFSAELRLRHMLDG